MTEPNPFSTLDSLNHLINPKIVTGATGYEVQVDVANVDTFYGRQLGGTANQFAQAYIQQIGTTGFPSQQAFINQIGTTGISGSAFFNTIGSTGSSGDSYFNTIHWRAFDPPLSVLTANGVTLQEGAGIEIVTQPTGQFVNSRIFGGPGISVNSPANGQPYIISSSGNKTILGSTGVRVDVAGLTYTLSSTVAVTGSAFINIQQTGATFTVTYTGSQASGAPSGVSGSYGVFDSTGTLSSSTVLTASNVVGPTGRVMLYSPSGPTYSNSLTLDVPGRTLYSPTLIVHDSIAYPNETGDYLRLTADTGSAFIQSYGTNAIATPLNISGSGGNKVLTTFDIPQGLVTINPGNAYPSGVQVVGASSATQVVGYPGGTYNVYLWGGGGDGALFPGGAGGYVKVQNIFGASGVTFSFNNASTAPGGGNAMGLFVNNGSGLIAAAVAPGGGAGGFRGPGAAYGEPGGSYPGQGYSALNGGSTGGLGGTFLQASFGSNTRYYTLGANYVGNGATFLNVPVTYGTTGQIANGSLIRVLGTNVSLNSITGLYTFSSGATLIFNTPGMTFTNSVYALSGITYAFFNSLTIGATAGVSGLFPGFTGITGNTNGSATFDPLIPASIATSGALVGGTFQNYTGPVGLSGNTYTIPLNSTLQLTPGSIFTIDTVNSIYTITLNTDDVFAFSQSLGGTNVTARLNGVTGTSGSVVQVGTTFGIVYGQNGSSTVGGSSGGGGGFFGGGGGVAGGGGGAGSAIILPGFSGVTGAGSGTSPFFDTYNLAGLFGFGGSGGAGGQPYYVIERVDSTLRPNVLNVNGNETVNGNLTVNGSALIQSSNSSIYAQSYLSSYAQNTGATAILVSDINFGASSTTFIDNTTASVKLRTLVEPGSFPGDGLSFVITNNVGSNNYTPTERFRVVKSTGPDGPYPAGSVVIGGITGASTSSLYVNGSINAFQPGTGGVRTAYFTNNLNFAAGRTLAIFNDQANGPQINFDDNTSAPPQGGSLSLVRGVSTGNFLMNIPLTVQGGITATTGNFSGLVTASAGITATTGFFTGNVTALDVTATSDMRLKENVVTIDSALEKVLKLRGVYFNRLQSEKRNVGVIAQEIEEVLPEVVHTDSDGMKSVAYGNIIGLLIEALKEQQEQINKLM